MNHIKYYLLAIVLLSVFSCEQKNSLPVSSSAKTEEPERIPVLNVGTFHMGFTTDATKTAFDEHDKENQKKVHEVAKKLAAFKPTVILVEMLPEHNEALQAEYQHYVNEPEMYFENPSEIELLAYELGRISGTKRIYGVDHKMNYNYRIGNEINNEIDPDWFKRFYSNPFQFYPEVNGRQDTLSLFEKLRVTNQDAYLDFLITANADMLTHAGTDNQFEGADEAAKFYQRNLRMYSNLNRINLDENDRVFLLMGAAHTAFFRDFMSRSPKYKMVNTFDYLK